MPADLEYVWMLEGDLQTTAPLSIGDGGEREWQRPAACPVEADPALATSRERQMVRVATVARTFYSGHPVASIPGTSLKGALHEAGGDNVERAFGSPERGGLISVIDAPAIEFSPDISGEYWCDEARTCCRASTAIDSHLGIADSHKLYYFEFVPAGVTFRLTLRGKSYADDGLRLSDMLSALGPGLSALGSGRPMLGGGVQNGWGAFRWARRPVVKKLAAAAIAAWTITPPKDGVRKSVFEHVSGLPPEPVDLQAVPAKAGRLSLTVRIAMDGAVLVNDLSRTVQSRGDGRPSHASLRHGARAFIPEKSIRGVLRHQAAKVLRTIGGTVPAVEVKGGKHLDVLHRKPLHALFGVPGWRAPLELTEFVAEQDDPFARQELIAIDRFTGGGIEGRKFNAEGARNVTLKGHLRIDLCRLGLVGGGIECLGLLALTLRDLAEGDSPIGWGSARGYGAVRALSATVDTAPTWAELPVPWQSAIAEEEYQVLVGPSAWPEKRSAMQRWVRALTEEIAKEN